MPHPTEPLVSCIMPTADRRAFVPHAIRYFLRQDYPQAELVIVDDGADPVADLLPDDPRLRYIRLEGRRTVGEKRNIACQHAHGTLIAHWDDDDWHANQRLSYQISALLAANADLCGINQLLFYDPAAGRAWRYAYPPNWSFWLSGSTLCYTRAFWEAHPFATVDVGEDARFVAAARPERAVVLPDNRFHVGLIHRSNVSPKQTSGVCWQALPPEQIRLLLGADWASYHPDAPVATPSAPAPVVPTRPLGPMVVAQAADLELPEFAALNHGQQLPWMRRWELPFALWQARLESTAAVLDCTINPAGFDQRLAALFPHALYRHHNPLQGTAFVPPLDLPDGAFDRVFCINTLEHLPTAQRSLLFAALAEKLKPGGRLIITCDVYFDTAWRDPAFLRSGLLRADRAEVLGGFNRVTPTELAALAQRYGLEPLGKLPPEPQQNDPHLLLQQPPYVHACIGSVFARPPLTSWAGARRVALALLTWNTCAISLESLQASVREAQMLERCGHLPLVLVCDNGSTDGTADELRRLQGCLNVPHLFILNHDNLGNSIARNQLIAAMRQHNADYLLFMDGDIEIVPGSSLAMLRYMENTGRQVGCIGAHYAGQTPNRTQATPFLYSIAASNVSSSNLLAWTQYGMFRRAVFEDGVAFDESEPFDRAGWGFEDNDLAFQMEMRGYQNRSFSGMVYLHRAARSSVANLRRAGLDPQLLCQRRQQYLIAKWSGVPQIAQGPLTTVRNMALRI